LLLHSQPGEVNHQYFRMLRGLSASILCFLGFLAVAQAQVGGLHTFAFLKLPPSARITSLGGSLIAVKDDDVTLALHNPALLNHTMHQQISFNHGFLIDGIQHGYAAFAHHAPNWNTTFHSGIQYVNYGIFNYADEYGNTTDAGTFKASEYAITLGASRQLDERISLGVNSKFLTSQLESYRAIGLAADLALCYADTTRRMTFALVMQNIGTQIQHYRPGNTESLPFNFQASISKKLAYLPFRFSVIYHHLHRWNLLYDNPNSVENSFLSSENPSDAGKFSMLVDNLFRHLIFNGELLIGQRESLRLRFGYNHFMRQELSVNNFRTISGITFGAGIRISRFRMDYGRNNYHLAGGVNHLSISTTLKEFRR
jgi:hypothetical protein